jgi:serine/threonine protein kinase
MCLKDNVLVAADGTLKLTDFGLAVMQDTMMQLSETDPGGGTA